MDHASALKWINKYVEAWRSPGTSQLDQIFADNIEYLPSPWRKPLKGLTQLKTFWEEARDGHDEVFALQKEIVAVEKSIVVARIKVDYAKDAPSKWRDLWIIEFNNDNLCCKFEEWPFSEGQFDGQKL